MQHSWLIKQYANDLRTFFGRSSSRTVARNQGGLNREIRILGGNFNACNFLQVKPTIQTQRPMIHRLRISYSLSH
jgi:hypothetical protein